MEKQLAGLINLVVTPCILAAVGDVSAEEKQNYIRPPLSVFSSQMQDALSGGGKYEKPVWNLHDFLRLPNWLTISLEQRTRYETMDGSFKAGGKGGDQQIALQTDVFLEARFGRLRAGGEFLDARQFASDQTTGINNTMVDEADFIQGYLAWADQNLFYSGIGAEVVAGRQTMNFGSRRLVARNVFRNTINSFDGVRLRLLDYHNWQFNAFVTMPVARYPNDPQKILDGVQEFDESDYKTWFSGGFLEIFDIAGGMNGELYLYYLDEGDRGRSPTRNRRYYTPGARFYIRPSKGKFDFQLEGIGQLGTVRASTAVNDGNNLSHKAWYEHADVGYTFDMPWAPRFALQYDYASGDKNPNDNKDGRFDTLYGARRFEFGPTGIYGAFARSNINSPGYRISIFPRRDLQAFLSHRVYLLAEARDSWTTAGLRDKTGQSGDYIGHQLELSARYDFNSSLNFETGWAHLFKGRFAKIAPNAPDVKDVDYFYVQSMLRF
jgi:hypothetical protein